MRSLTRRLAPHARAAWLTFAAVAACAAIVSITVALLVGDGRVAVVMTAFSWFVLVVVSAAVLDAILVPGNPDVRRWAGHDAGWTGMGAPVSLPEGRGGDGGSC